MNNETSTHQIAKERKIRTTPESIDSILYKSELEMTGTERNALRLYLNNTVFGAGNSELRRSVQDRIDQIRDVLNLHVPASVGYTPNLSHVVEPQEEDDTEAKVEAVIVHGFVNEIIDIEVRNWTHHSGEPDPEVMAVLVEFAKDVARKILNDPIEFPSFGTNWRDEVSNAVHSQLNYQEFKKEAIKKITKALKVRFPDIENYLENGRWGSSLINIACHTGSAANMIANRLDPDLLLLSDEESDQRVLETMQKIAKEDPDKAIVATPEDHPIDIILQVKRKVEEAERRKNEKDRNDNFRWN